MLLPPRGVGCVPGWGCRSWLSPRSVIWPTTRACLRDAVNLQRLGLFEDRTTAAWESTWHVNPVQ